MPLNAIYTPRGTTKLWPLPPGEMTRARAMRQSFKPNIIRRSWSAPPLPTWKRKIRKQEKPDYSVDRLKRRGEELREQAQEVADQAYTPSIKEKLGMYLIALGEGELENMIKRWQSKGRDGEVSRTSMRLHLRACVPEMTSAESDSIFDEWDTVHRDGALDKAELRSGLDNMIRIAKAFYKRPDPEKEQAERLRNHALVADQAAEEIRLADELQLDYENFNKELSTRTDVRLGALLQKRLITPGEFVLRFGKPGTPRNVTQAELTKSEFRHAVLLLLAGHVKLGGKAFSKTVGGSPVKTRQDHSRSIRLPSFSELQTNVKEIDAVFEHYDLDHDGTLNMEEAKTMIKGLHNAGRDAEQIRRRKEHATKVQRIRAERKAAVAMSDALDDKKVTVVGQRSMRPSVTNQVEVSIEMDIMEA